MADGDSPIPNIGNFAKAQIAADAAERERHRQAANNAAALTGLIGAGDAAGAGCPRAGAGDQANQMLEMM
jgi:hypothetical protein